MFVFMASYLSSELIFRDLSLGFFTVLAWSKGFFCIKHQKKTQDLQHCPSFKNFLVVFNVLVLRCNIPHWRVIWKFMYHATCCRTSASKYKLSAHSAGIVSFWLLVLIHVSIRFAKEMYLKQDCCVRYRKHHSSTCFLVTGQLRRNLTDYKKHCNHLLSRVQLKKKKIRCYTSWLC